MWGVINVLSVYQKSTHRYYIAQFDLYLLGKVLLKEELNREAIFILKNWL